MEKPPRERSVGSSRVNPYQTSTKTSLEYVSRLDFIADRVVNNSVSGAGRAVKNWMSTVGNFSVDVYTHSPSDPEGSWPCRSVRDVLDRAELEDLRRGFRTGVFDKRGVKSRYPDEGGAQER